jgi:hypothetical protein
MLKLELPVQWHNGASHLMNQRTAALLPTHGVACSCKHCREVNLRSR